MTFNCERIEKSRNHLKREKRKQMDDFDQHSDSSDSSEIGDDDGFSEEEIRRRDQEYIVGSYVPVSLF